MAKSEVKVEVGRLGEESEEDGDGEPVVRPLGVECRRVRLQRVRFADYGADNPAPYIHKSKTGKTI